MSDKRPVVVYGASGFSARLTIEFLREYDVPFVAAGRDREKIEEVLAHVPGIGTADYEIVQVDHDVDALASLLEGARVVCNTVGPCIYHGSTVAEAALKAGCHYIDTGGETPWVRLAHEEWGAKFAEAGLLLAPATAYMSAVAEACARIAIERAPGIDSLEILSMFMGFPTYGSTQTIFGQLQWESIYLEQNEYKEWPPVTTLEVTIPSAITTQLALPWGGFPHPVWFKDHPQIANVRAFGGLLDRSLMEGIVAGQRDYQEKIKPLPAEEQRQVLAGIADSMQSGLPPRENRRQQRTVDVVVGRGTLDTIRVSAHGQGAYLQTGLIQAFAAHHLVHPRRARSASPRRARPSAIGRSSRRSRPTGSSGSKSARQPRCLVELREPAGRGRGDPRADAELLDVGGGRVISSTRRAACARRPVSSRSSSGSPITAGDVGAHALAPRRPPRRQRGSRAPRPPCPS